MQVRVTSTEANVQMTRHELHYLQFLMKEERKYEPEYVSQNGAYKRFGQANVKRWERNDIIKKYYRPNVTEFNLEELRSAAANRQDYEIV